VTQRASTHAECSHGEVGGGQSSASLHPPASASPSLEPVLPGASDVLVSPRPVDSASLLAVVPPSSGGIVLVVSAVRVVESSASA
jgi:hypothetical protein